MIIIGYKKNFQSILRAAIALVLGISLFAFKMEAVDVIIRIIGIGILFAGVISLVPLLSKPKEGEAKKNSLGNIIGLTTCGIASLIGLVVVMKPSWFTNLFIFIVAAAIIVFCAIQLISLISAMRLVGYTTVPLVLNIVALVGAIVVMFFEPGRTICIVSGILLLIYGISEIVALFQIRKAEEIYIEIHGPVADAQPAKSTSSDALVITSVKDADYEEVKK